MPNERASLGIEGLDDLTDDIDIDVFAEPEKPTVTTTPKSKKDLAATLIKAGEQHGFVSRESKPAPKRRRKVSPYTAQFGGKCRPGMKELFQKIGDELNCYDTETLEEAILALIEKKKLKHFKEEYQSLINK
jgi:hypothetical protein